MKLKPRPIGVEAALVVDRHGASQSLNALIEHMGLKNDAELSRVLGVEAATISKIRNGKLSIGASMLLRMHEVSDLSVKELRMLMRDPCSVLGGALPNRIDDS